MFFNDLKIESEEMYVIEIRSGNNSVVARSETFIISLPKISITNINKLNLSSISFTWTTVGIIDKVDISIICVDGLNYSVYEIENRGSYILNSNLEIKEPCDIKIYRYFILII